VRACKNIADSCCSSSGVDRLFIDVDERISELSELLVV